VQREASGLEEDGGALADLRSGRNAVVAIATAADRRQHLPEPVLDFLLAQISAAIDDKRLHKLAFVRPGFECGRSSVEPTRNRGQRHHAVHDGAFR
jgi:hypothetical protein